MPAKKVVPREKPQFDRFLEAAKEIGATETDGALADTIRRITPKPISVLVSLSSRQPLKKGRS